VSTKNIGADLSSLGLTREVIVTPHIRHRGQQVCQLAAGWVQERRRQDGAVLSFGAVAMFSGSLLQGTHHSLLNAPHQEISHERD
jgi:hypothetical protein